MFRPCIDLHEGKVKQIVGGTLGDAPSDLRTNFVSERSSVYYAELYRRDGLSGGHVIMLGPGNEEAGRAALKAYPGGLQIGGGITVNNAASYLNDGASHVIITSWVFQGGNLDTERLSGLVKAIGKEKLVLDLSCRRRGNGYFVVTDRWQKFTTMAISEKNLHKLAANCAEFLVHAVDVEGLCSGIDHELVARPCQVVADTRDLCGRGEFTCRAGGSDARGAGENRSDDRLRAGYFRGKRCAVRGRGGVQ